MLVLKVAQDGLPVIEKLGLSPAESVAVGVKEYVLPTATLVGGLPEIVSGADVGGGVLDGGGCPMRSP